MIVLLDVPPSTPLERAAEELGTQVEQLFTPSTRYNPQKPEECFAIDNGAFSGLNVREFESLLEKHRDRRSLCRWVAVPDVVASARRTLELFDYWAPRLLDHWPLAFVAQDGQENLPIPWEDIDAIFIGGSTEFKLSAAAAQIVRCAKGQNKWIHAGRVNTPARFEYFEELGADSIDGTGLARYSWMRKNIHDRIHFPKLIDDFDELPSNVLD